MDKNVRTIATIACVGSLLFVALIVVLLNLPKNNHTGNPVPTENLSEVTLEETSKAFLYDKDFIDEFQPNLIAGADTKENGEAYLIGSTVSGDIRVTVLDGNGKVISGVPITIDIKNLGEYEDSDGDGSVYISGIKPGNYEIELKELPGYVCLSPISISVKDSVEYTALSDISYLIKTEADIDAAQEDTMENTAESDETEQVDAILTRKDAVFGIDVSKWNGVIDWKKVADSGVEFAIIRIGYRGSKTGALVEDPYFKENLQGAKDAGVKVGVYFFTQALNEREAVEEASCVLTLLGDTALDYPIYIDTESSSGGRADSLDVISRTTVVDTFCKTIERSGRNAGIYASRNWFYNKLNDQDLRGHQRWLAEYREEPLYTGNYSMWQYTSSGNIDGITGRVDLDLGFK